MRAHHKARTGTQQAHGEAEPTPPPDNDGEPPFSVHPHRSGSDEPNPLHYSDLMLITKRGRITIELELYPTGRRRLETIIAAYGADPNITALYLVDNRAVGRAIQKTAARLELSARVHVQLVQYDRTAPGAIAQ